VTVPSGSSSSGRPATARASSTARASPPHRPARAASSPASRAGSAAGTCGPAPAAPSASAATISCSVKNGFPSARANSSSTSAGSIGWPARAAACLATSCRDSGPRVISSVAAAPRASASHSATCGFKGASSLRQVTTTRTAPGHPARPRKVRQSSVSLSAQCTSSTTSPTPAADLAATTLSNCATPENSRSRCHPPPRSSTPGPPPSPSCGTNRPTSPRTNPGAAPSAASIRPPPSSPASSPSATAIGSNGNVPATGRHSPRTTTIPDAAAWLIPSPASIVLPTPASPTTSTIRASPPSAPSNRDSSPSRPIKATGPAIRPAHQPAPAASIPTRYHPAAPSA